MYRKIVCQDELQRVIHKGKRNVLLSGVAGLRERNQVLSWGEWWYQPQGWVEVDGEIHHHVHRTFVVTGVIFAWSRGVSSWVGGGSCRGWKYRSAGRIKAGVVLPWYRQGVTVEEGSRTALPSMELAGLQVTGGAG